MDTDEAPFLVECDGEKTVNSTPPLVLDTSRREPALNLVISLDNVYASGCDSSESQEGDDDDEDEWFDHLDVLFVIRNPLDAPKFGLLKDGLGLHLQNDFAVGCLGEVVIGLYKIPNCNPERANVEYGIFLLLYHPRLVVDLY